jgi:hypothetical protein
VSTQRNTSRYPTPEYRRMALAPAIVVTIALLAGVAAIGGDVYLVIRFIVAIFALIVGVFAWQARQWWWLILLVPIAVVFNPVLPLDIDRAVLLLLHYAAAIVFIAAGILIKVRNQEDRNSR